MPYSDTMSQTEEQRAKFERDLAAFWEQNPDREFFAGAQVCAGCLALAKAQRIVQEMDEKAEKANKKTYPHARVWSVYQRPKSN